MDERAVIISGDFAAAGHALQRQGEEAAEANAVRRRLEQTGGHDESKVGPNPSVDQQENHRLFTH